MPDKPKGTRGRWTGGPFKVAKTVEVDGDLGKLLKQIHSTRAAAATAVREFITLDATGLEGALEIGIETAKLKAAKDTLRGFDPKVAAAALKALEDERVPTGTQAPGATDLGIGGDPQGQGKTPREDE